MLTQEIFHNCTVILVEKYSTTLYKTKICRGLTMILVKQPINKKFINLAILYRLVDAKELLFKWVKSSQYGGWSWPFQTGWNSVITKDTTHNTLYGQPHVSTSARDQLVTEIL